MSAAWLDRRLPLAGRVPLSRSQASRVFLLLLFVIIPAWGQQKKACPDAEADLSFLVPNNVAVAKEDFQQMLDFARGVIVALPPYPKIRVSLVTYFNATTIYFLLKDDTLKTDFLNSSAGYSYYGDRGNVYNESSIVEALGAMNTNVFVANGGDRQAAPNIGILLAAAHIDENATAKEVEAARQAKNAILVIRLGSILTNQELEVIADQDKNRFSVDSAVQLSSIMDDVLTRICDILGLCAFEPSVSGGSVQCDNSTNPGPVCEVKCSLKTKHVGPIFLTCEDRRGTMTWGELPSCQPTSEGEVHEVKGGTDDRGSSSKGMEPKTAAAIAAGVTGAIVLLAVLLLGTRRKKSSREREPGSPTCSVDSDDQGSENCEVEQDEGWVEDEAAEERDITQDEEDEEETGEQNEAGETEEEEGGEEEDTDTD